MEKENLENLPKATQNFCVSLARAQVTRTIQKINCIFI